MPGAGGNLHRAGSIDTSCQLEHLVAAAHTGPARSSPFFGLTHAKTPFGALIYTYSLGVIIAFNSLDYKTN